VHGCHAFVPRLRAQGRGAIINVASTAGVAAAPEMAPYNTTKAAVIALSETLAAELSGANIGVTVLCPTFITTGIFDAGRMSEQSREAGRRMAARSKYSADDAARDTIAALERGELYVFPQRDAKWVWRLKRLAPRAYGSLVGLAYRRGVLLR
jgi:short-subunit dehydrogenase